MIAQIILFTAFLVGGNCFYISQELNSPTAFKDLEEYYFEQPFKYVHPVQVRERRQVHGLVTTIPDGTTNILAKLPLAGNNKNIVSAIGGLDVKDDGAFKAASAGLTLDNVHRHGLSLTGKHIPELGDQLTAAAKVNLLNTDQHDLSVNAFATRTLPKDPVIPNFNTYGGGVDYMFDKNIGASLSAAHTPLVQKTDYSALGKLNLFRDRTSSLDFSAGASKSMSPFIPNNSWQPTLGLSFSKYFYQGYEGIIFFLYFC